MTDDEAWFDEAAGPLVRPYAVTRGRTRTLQPEIELITLVVAAQRHIDPGRLDPEYTSILQLCQRPTSVAEISARLDLPLGAVKVLIGDLIERRLLLFRSALTPDNEVLQAVLDGIRRL